MVLMEKALSWARNGVVGGDFRSPSERRVDPSLDNQLSDTLVLTGIKPPQLLGGFEVKDKLYNMEPYAGPERHYDLGIDLYDMEAGWK